MRRPSLIVGVFPMVFISRFTVGSMRQLFCRKPPKTDALSCDHDTSHPMSLTFNAPNALAARHIVFLYRLIRLILAVSCFSKIVKSIISSYAVNMVNLVFGPLSRHVKPCEPMRFVSFPGDHYKQVSIAVDGTRNIANFDSAGRARQPRKNPSFRAIVEDGFKVFLRNLHDAPLMRIGVSGAVASNYRSAILTQMTRSGGGYRTVKYR